MIVTSATAHAIEVGCATLTVSAGLAAWFDGRYRRIPNWLCAVTTAAGFGFAVWITGFPGAFSYALHFLIALVGGMVLFRLGVFGGGDAKYYAAVAAWFALKQAVALLLAVTTSGLILLIVWFVARRVAGMPIRRSTGAGLDGLPYGIAIGAGAVITATSMIPSASQVV